MKKLRVNVTQNIHVRDELKIEKVQGIDHILWKGRHYYADVTWYKVLNEEEMQESFIRNKKISEKLNLEPIKGDKTDSVYGDESVSVNPDEVEEDILIDSSDSDYFYESGCTFELE